MYSKSWTVGLGVGTSDLLIKLWITMVESMLVRFFSIGYESHIHDWDMARG